MLRIIRNGIRLPRIFNSLRGKPGHYVGDFLVGHGFVRHVSAPVWGPQFRAASDDNRAQPLIADQREKRIIGDGAAFWSSATARAVAGCAVSFVCDFALNSIARGFRGIGRWNASVENSPLAPARSDSTRNRI